MHIICWDFEVLKSRRSQWRINTCTRNAKVKIMNIEKIYGRRHCKLRQARQAWTRQGCSHFYRIPRKVIVLGICKKTLFIKGQRGREEDRPQPGFRVHLRFQAISFKWTMDENSTGPLMIDFVTWSCFQKASCYIQNKVNLRSPPKNFKSHISFENFRILRLIFQSYYHNLRYSLMRLWLTMCAT